MPLARYAWGFFISMAFGICNPSPQYLSGKYRGKLIENIVDIRYLEYSLRKHKLSAGLRDAIIRRIAHLEFLGR